MPAPPHPTHTNTLATVVINIHIQVLTDPELMPYFKDVDMQKQRSKQVRGYAGRGVRDEGRGAGPARMPGGLQCQAETVLPGCRSVYRLFGCRSSSCLSCLEVRNTTRHEARLGIVGTDQGVVRHLRRRHRCQVPAGLPRLAHHPQPL